MLYRQSVLCDDGSSVKEGQTMRMNKKIIIAVLGAVLAGSLLGGCGSQGSGSSAANIKSEVHIAMNASPDTYDICKTTAIVAKEMMLGNVFESLVTMDGDYKPRPELAEKIDTNQDDTEYTYHLRKGVSFHNGEEMKADDVVASMNRWIESSGGVKSAVGDARFEKVDDYTVRIQLQKPLATLNEMIAGSSPVAIIVPKSVIDQADPKTGMITQYIGTGPYMVDQIVPDSYLQLKKFDQYKPYGEKGKNSGWWGYKEAKTPVIVYNFVPDSSTRTAGMQSGEYDIVTQMPIDDYNQFKGNSSYQISKEIDGEIGMVYNKKRGLASNPLFRQAVNAALNDDDIMKAAYADSEFYELSSSYIIGHSNPWYSESGKEYYNQKNPDKTRQLLQQAGYNGEEFTVVVSSQYPAFYNAAVVVERELKDAGVNVKLDVVDWATYLTKSRDANAYDAFITGFAVRNIPAAITYLSPTWNGWSDDPRLVQTMGRINTTPDQKQAASDWSDLQGYLWNTYLPVSKFGNYYNYDVTSDKVQGFEFFQGSHAWNMTVSE